MTSIEDYPTSFFGIAKRILKEEGMIRFYRGYSAYMLAIIFWMSALPTGTDFVSNVIPQLADRFSGRQTRTS